MSNTAPSTGVVGDAIALGLQSLRRAQAQKAGQPLLKIDNTEDAKNAPFQFDAARGRIHRNGCSAIPKSSESALYGVWRVGPEEMELACPRCKPEPTKPEQSDPNIATDMFYGLLSVIDQFGGVLRERGREYRRSQDGQKVGKELDSLYRGIGEREREILQTVITSLDGMVKVVKDFECEMTGPNGHTSNGKTNGREANGGKPNGQDTD